MDSEGSFVNEEIEAIIEFYEALCVESTLRRGDIIKGWKKIKITR